MPYRILRCYIAIIVCALFATAASLLLIFGKRFPRLEKALERREKLVVAGVLSLGFLGYVISVFGYLGVEKFVRDFDVFLMWSRMMLDEGIKGFMTEYPPFGMYLLAAFQGLLRLFNLQDNYIITSVVMKLPAIAASLAIAYLAYRWAKKSHGGLKAVLIMTVLAYNPAFLINASMWGQMDMVMVFLAVLSFYFLKQEKIIPAALIYTAGCLTKPQMIFLAPVFGMFMILPLFNKDTAKRTAKRLLIALAASFALFFAATLPFKQSFFDIWIADFFKHIANEHPVNTASAFNLFGLHGGSFQPDTDRFLFLNYKIWGYVFIGLVCVLCGWLSVKNKEGRNVFLLGAFCVAAVFTLGVSMHERYVLPAVAMLIVSSIYLKSKTPVILALLYTLLAAVNQCIILFDLFGGKTWTFKLFSGISVAIFAAFLIYIMFEIAIPKKIKAETDEGYS